MTNKLPWNSTDNGTVCLVSFKEDELTKQSCYALSTYSDNARAIPGFYSSVGEGFGVSCKQMLHDVQNFIEISTPN